MCPSPRVVPPEAVLGWRRRGAVGWFAFHSKKQRSCGFVAEMAMVRLLDRCK